MPTAYDPSQVRLAPDGKVLVAPLSSTEPVNVTTPFAAAWVELGWVTEDGVSVTPSVDTNDIMMWQSINPVKRPITGMGLEISMTLGSHSKKTFEMYLLNGTTTNVTGTARLEVKNAPAAQDVALAVEWTDDEGDISRLIFPRVTMTDREAITLQRSEAVGLGLTFSSLAGPNGYSAVLLSNNTDLLS